MGRQDACQFHSGPLFNLVSAYMVAVTYSLVPFTQNLDQEYLRAFQVQMTHFGEMKGPCISHIFCRIVAVYLDFLWFPGLKILGRDSKFYFDIRLLSVALLLMISFRLANGIFLSSQSRISHSMTFVKLLQGYLSMEE